MRPLRFTRSRDSERASRSLGETMAKRKEETMTDEDRIRAMVEKFQCPGCVAGSDTKCGYYKVDPSCPMCTGHVMGTMMLPGPGNFALGVPKGFNRGGWCMGENRTHSRMYFRFYPKGSKPYTYDYLNVPVWSLEKDGYLFVRVAQPRIAGWVVDVYEGGKASAICPQAFDVAPKYDEYD